MTEDNALKLALKARAARNHALDALAADPIAVIGLGCRLPGDVRSPKDFWGLLRDGRDVIASIPVDRWLADDIYDPDIAAPGKSITREAGFLTEIDQFDADYFGILPREAEQMDPQQRLFLEVAIEALDDAGQPQDRLARSRTGVYVASYHNDYAKLIYDDPEALDLRSLTGTLHSVLANRLSWFLDLRGPSLSLDTACSSSLVAIHLACQSLRFGETDLALAGGVSLIITPNLMISMSKVGFMSPDGRCKTFDAAADGFGRGEGCGVVVLKRLSDAIADQDRVLAVIRGTAVNQDGRSTVMAAPNGLAQEDLIREALAKGQIEAGRIGFVEAHGTGTALGDPIEVEALAATIGRAEAAATPCLLGSAKANIGHLEAAAGVTGLIKTVLALRHEAIPPQPNYNALNPHIDLSGTRLAVAAALTPWPAGPLPRAAAVSSFGVGGTNAHIILEEAPRVGGAASPAHDEVRPRLLPLSAKTPAALQELCGVWARHLSADETPLADLCRTSGERRTHYSVRKAIVASTRQDFERALLQARDGEISRDVPGRPRVAFVFCGQGPQWHAMGRQLLATEAPFRETMERINSVLQPLSGFSLLEELGRSADDTRLDATMVAQPALFALQVSLCAQLAHWGLTPDAVVGHSIGELAALHVSGVLNLEEATRIVWHRACLMQSATGMGRMAAVSLSATAAEELVSRHPGLDVAAFNAPASTVLSGTAAALDAALTTLDARGVSYRRLPVDYAFHSAQMEPIQAELVRALGRIMRLPAVADVYSTVLGGRLDERLVDATYFGRNVRDPVRFAAAGAALLADGYDLLVEIGPHPVLGPALDGISAAMELSPRILTTLKRGGDERQALLATIAGAYEAGLDPDWGAISDGEGAIVSLPSYPWQRKRYWIADRGPKATATAGPLLHPVVGRAVSLATEGQRVFQGSSLEAGTWLADHRLAGKIVLPAAAVMEALVKAAALAHGAEATALADFTMDRPVLIADGEEVRWQVVADVSVGGGRELALYVADGSCQGEWAKVATARLADAPASSAPLGAPGDDGEAHDADDVYVQFERHGVEFGPQFRVLQEINAGPGWASAHIAGSDKSDDGFLVPPPVLDAALQLATVAASAWDAAYLPVGAESVRLAQWAGEPLVIFVRAVLRGSVLKTDISIKTTDGANVARIEGMSFARANTAALSGGRCETYVEEWIEAPAPATAAPRDGVWLVYDDAAGTCARALASVSQKIDCWTVQPGAMLKQCGPRTWQVDPVSAHDAVGLFERAPWGKAPLRGIVHAWSLDAKPEVGLEREDELALASLLHLIQAARLHPAPLCVVTGASNRRADGQDDATSIAAAGAAGLARVAAIEESGLGVRMIDISLGDHDLDRLGREILADGPERIALRRDRRLMPRLRRPVAATRHRPAPVRLVTVRPGDFSGLELMPSQAGTLGADDVRLRVRATGLNFRDVLTALDLYPGTPPPLGVECVGEVIEAGAGATDFAIGERVFGYVPGSLATEVTVPAAFVSRVPDGLDDEQAATIPVAFATALYALERLAGLRPGEHVLIHAAAGGVGMAAVQIALAQGAVVHATVGSSAKRERLRAIGAEYFYNSRKLDFAEEIRAATGGRGVDVVLNSLAGPFVDASFRCLTHGGRFLEIGKRDVWSPERAATERPDAAYHLFDLGSEAERDRSLFGSLLKTLSQWLTDGRIKPLPVVSFPISRAAEAMRMMAQARHIGKIVIGVSDQQQSFRASPEASYLITGGLGALGLETADWLIGAGARHLVLCGRSAPGEDANRRIEAWREAGVDVRVEACNVADETDIGGVIDRMRATMPSLRGVVHAAGVLHDGTLANQPWAEAARVLEGKAHGARHLDRLTRNLDLDFFILYSAGAVVLGSAGQGLYPAANGQLDAVARQRSAAGLPALSVAWGLWSGMGMASGAADEVWAARGLRPLNPATAFAEMERLLSARIAHGAILDINWSRFLSRAPAGLDLSYFAEIAPRTTSAIRPATPEANSPIQTIRKAPARQRRDLLSTFLGERIVQILGLSDAISIDAKRPLKDYGIDSLMAVELRNLLARAGGTSLPSTLLFDYPTFDTLLGFLMKTWNLEEAPAPALDSATTVKTAPDDAAALEAMSDTEIEDLLREELDLAGSAS